MSDLFNPTIARTPAAYEAAGKNNNTINSIKGNDNRTDNSGFYKPANSDNLSLTMQQFLQLMIVQFQNQDMDNPASTSEMMNQIMQMSTIQAMATMTDAATMSYAASLVGKTVTVGDYSAGKLKEVVGVVTGTGTYDGEQVVFIDGKTYKLSSIMAVGEIPEKKPENKPDQKPEGGENTGGDTSGGGGTGTGGSESTTPPQAI